MPASVAAILQGIVLGLGAAAPIGPVNVEIARRTLRGGFRQGLLLGCGAVTVDVGYAILSSLSVRGLADRPAVVVPLTVAGAAFLAYLGVQSLRAARAAWRVDPMGSSANQAGGGRGAYLTGLLMTLLNPMTLAFWFVAVPATLGGIDEGRAGRLPMICVGVLSAPSPGSSRSRDS